MNVQFGCIVADPPWRFADKLPGKSRGAERNYSCMSTKEIADYQLPPILPDCWLFLWRVAAMQQEALDVAKSWGFTVKSEIVWIKTCASGRPRIGMGRTVRNAHEICLVCTRGKPKVVDHSVPSVIHSVRGLHSEKPEELQDYAERIVGDVPKCELFARRRRPGWVCFGDELGANETPF